jgi:hypothetical protein
MNSLVKGCCSELALLDQMNTYCTYVERRYRTAPRLVSGVEIAT